MIRHAKVDMIWPKKCSSKEFDNACKQYDKANIVNNDIKAINIDSDNIYVSSLYRSKETAKRLFPNRYFSEIEVGEVPLKSYKDCSLQIPLWIWNVMGRMQWYFNNRRQDENRLETVERCIRVIDKLESEDKDSVIVTHAFFLKIFIKCLKHRGYSIDGNNIRLSNLQIVVAESRK